MRDHDRVYIGGQWVAPAGSATIDVISPRTEEVIGRVPDGTSADNGQACVAQPRILAPRSRYEETVVGLAGMVDARGGDCREGGGAGVAGVVAFSMVSAALLGICEGAGVGFHLAAVYRFWAPDARIYSEVNVGGTINVLEGVRAAGCERLVYTATVGV